MASCQNSAPPATDGSVELTTGNTGDFRAVPVLPTVWAHLLGFSSGVSAPFCFLSAPFMRKF